MAKSKLSLTGSDFSSSIPSKFQSLSLIYGDAGTLKSSFAYLYCPEPVFLINFDGRDLPAFERARDLGREVYRVQIDLPADIDSMDIKKAQELGKSILAKTMKNYRWCLDQARAGNIATIGWDTATEATRLMATAFCGRTQAPNNDFGRTKGHINSLWMEDIGKAARQTPAHLVILSRAKEIWIDNKPSGYYEFRCPEAVNESVDWSANIRLRRLPNGKLTKDSELMIAKAVNIAEVGKVYTARDWQEDGPFAYTCWQMWEKSEIEDWKTQ